MDELASTKLEAVPRTDAPARPHVVIVGAGFGGLNAAKALSGAPVDVTVIDRRNYHLFQPLLYQVATAGLTPAEFEARKRALEAWGRDGAACAAGPGGAVRLDPPGDAPPDSR